MASRSGRPHRTHRATMKCPTCQGRVETLGKLFLDFECITNTDVHGDDDLMSLSSEEGNDKEEEPKDPDVPNIEPIAEISAGQQQQPEIIVLDDDDDDVDVTLQQTNALQKIRKYKKMTYKWKTKCEQTESVLRNVNRENGGLSKKVQELNRSLTVCKEEFQQRRENTQNMSAELADLRHRVIEHRERSKRLETSLAHRDSQLVRAKSDLKRARIDTEKARTNYVVEAAELLKEHPVLAAKVKDLEHQNRLLQAQLQRQQICGKGTTSNASMAKADQRKLLRRVSDLRERQDAQQQQRNKNQQQQQQEPPRKKAVTSTASAGMAVLEQQPVLTTGLLHMGKKRNPVPSDRRRYAAYAGAPQKKKLKSSSFR